MLELIIAVILSSVPIMLAATGELVVERSGGNLWEHLRVH